MACAVPAKLAFTVIFIPQTSIAFPSPASHKAGVLLPRHRHNHNITAKAAKAAKAVAIEHQGSLSFGLGYSPNTMNENIKNLCSDKRLKEALDILREMDQRDIRVERSTYSRLLQTSADLRALEQGKQIHAFILLKALGEDIYINSKLLNMYVMCGALAEARLVFDQVEIPKRTRFFWNMIIRAYSTNGLYEETLLLYEEMLLAGVQPNRFTFPFVLKACGCTNSLDVGRDIHDYVFHDDLDSDAFVASALVDMYAMCGCLEDARHVFDKMLQPNDVAWNAMIAGYARNGRCDEAVELLEEMKKGGERPDVASWNAIVAGYARNGHGQKALDILREMQMVPVEPDLVTVTSALQACATSAILQEGKEIHAYIIKVGYDSEYNIGCALEALYAKCGSTEDARLVYNEISQRHASPRNAIFSGHR